MQTIRKLKNPIPELAKGLEEIEARLKAAEESVNIAKEQYGAGGKIFQFTKEMFECLTIRDWDGRKMPFKLNGSQVLIMEDINRQLMERVPVRLIVLKSRKHGCSTFLAAVVYILLKKFQFKATIVGQERRAAENLYKMVRLFHTTDPNGMGKPEIRNKRELIFREGGEVWAASADVDALERSQSNQILLLTEFAFWPNPEKQMTALLDTVASNEMTFVFVESTANGVDNDFHRRWLEAESGFDEDRNPLHWVGRFLPWTLLAWNSKNFSNKKRKDQFMASLSRDERALLDDGVTPEQLQWRRMKILAYSGRDWNHKLPAFCQEHPITADEAFLNTGRSKFNKKILNTWYNKAKLLNPPIFTGDIARFTDTMAWQTFSKDFVKACGGGPDADPETFINGFFTANTPGEFRVWEWPEPYLDYDIGSDVALGIKKKDDSNDSSAFHVFRKDTRTVVMTFKSDETPPEDLAEVLANIGFAYNQAFICVEANNMGDTTLKELYKIYPQNRIYRSKRGENVAYQEDSQRLGHWTNDNTKTKILNRLAYVIREQKIKVYDLETIAEMTRVVIDNNGRVETNGMDLTMALALTLEAYAVDANVQFNKPPSAKTYDEEYEEWRESVRRKAAFRQMQMNAYEEDSGLWEIAV